MTDRTLCPDCEERPQDAAGLCHRCYLRRRRRSRGVPMRGTGEKRDGVQTYDGMHNNIRHFRGSASSYTCVDCHCQADDWSYRGGCADERITAEKPYPWCPHIYCYEPRCKKCHFIYDKRSAGNRGNQGNRGNHSRGENHYNAKLTEAVVREARRRRSHGVWLSKLAAEYGVTKTAMHDAIIGKTWKHVT